MSHPIVPLTVPKSRRFEKKGRNDILIKIRLGKVELTFFQAIHQIGRLQSNATDLLNHKNSPTFIVNKS